jgi:transcriptional regulator NrdR family protein
MTKSKAHDESRQTDRAEKTAAQQRRLTCSRVYTTAEQPEWEIVVIKKQQTEQTMKLENSNTAK